MGQNIPVGQRRVAHQSGFHWPHRPLAQCYPLLVYLSTALDKRVNALPGHTFGPLQHGLHIHQLRPVPVQFQDAPALLDGIILANALTLKGLIRIPGSP